MPMADPLVSVHILTYNQESYIARAIEGALQQETSFGVEIVVGEDCSTDKTGEIVWGHQRRYPERIRVITSERNVGAFANSRRVLAACRGKYVAICDGDDYWTDPHKLQKQVDFLEAHPEYSLCCHDIKVVCDGVPLVCTYARITKNTFTFEDAVRRHFIPTVSIVSRREWLPTLPSWLSECIGVDIFLELLLLDHGPGWYLHETMAVKVDNARGISRIHETKTQESQILLRMYRQTDRYTEGRHREIVNWKIARLNLVLARENLKAGRWTPFLKYLLASLRCDPTVVTEAVRRRLHRPTGAPA